MHVILIALKTALSKALLFIFWCELIVSCKHFGRFKTEERLTVLYAPRSSIIFSQESNVFRLVLSHKRIRMRCLKYLCAESSLCHLGIF